jgi:hypothetical protein
LSFVIYLVLKKCNAESRIYNQNGL